MTTLDPPTIEQLKIADETAENRFKRYFPHNIRLSCFTADEQFDLLYRAYWLCVKSNRRKEIKINQRIPDTVLVARRADGVCCHPIFITQSIFKTRRDQFKQPDFIYALLIKNCILKRGDRENRLQHERHPSYCEELKHGDLLKLVVPDEFYPDVNRYRLASEFEAGEGCFVWHVDKHYPRGYPKLISCDSEEIKTLFDFEI